MDRPSIPTYITLTAVGDIMLGDGPVYAGHGVGSMIKRRGATSIFKNIESLIKKGDIAFGNLEAVVSNEGIDSSKMKSFLMRAHPDTLKGLSSAGFNLMSVANNHALQYGEKGLKETLNHLSEHCIDYIGVGETFEDARRPHLITVKDTRFAFLAYCLIPDKTAYISTTSPEDIISDIKQSKTISEIVIVSIHWGNEFIEVPTLDQIRLAHRMIDAGANLILGHHPHILQGIEQYHDGLITYSLGNFIFDSNCIEELRTSVILECRFSRNGIIDYELHPVYIDKYYCPVVLNGEDKSRALLKIKKQSSILASEYYIQEYNNKLPERRRSVKRRMISHFICNIYRYPLKYSWFTMTQYLKKMLK